MRALSWLQELLGMVRPVIFVPYFLHMHSATGQSFTLTINLDTNQFHLHINLHQQACTHNPNFTNNFPIIILLI